MSVHFLPSLRQTAPINGLGLHEAGRHLRVAARLLATAVSEAIRRQRTRRDLIALEGHLLRDIGITPLDAAFEANKPFWAA